MVLATVMFFLLFLMALFHHGRAGFVTHMAARMLHFLGRYGVGHGIHCTVRVCFNLVKYRPNLT